MKTTQVNKSDMHKFVKVMKLSSWSSSSGGKSIKLHTACGESRIQWNLGWSIFHLIFLENNKNRIKCYGSGPIKQPLYTYLNRLKSNLHVSGKLVLIEQSCLEEKPDKLQWFYRSDI